MKDTNKTEEKLISCKLCRILFDLVKNEKSQSLGRSPSKFLCSRGFTNKLKLFVYIILVDHTNDPVTKISLLS